MTSIRWSRIVSSVFLLAIGFVLGGLSPFGSVSAQPAARVYELRTYTAPDGKLGDLHARFRNHTPPDFPAPGDDQRDLSVADGRAAQGQHPRVPLSYPSREAAKASWDAFRIDPEWKQVASESQKNGPLTAKVESVFFTPTDYSPMK